MTATSSRTDRTKHLSSPVPQIGASESLQHRELEYPRRGSVWRCRPTHFESGTFERLAAPLLCAPRVAAFHLVHAGVKPLGVGKRTVECGFTESARQGLATRVDAKSPAMPLRLSVFPSASALTCHADIDHFVGRAVASQVHARQRGRGQQRIFESDPRGPGGETTYVVLDGHVAIVALRNAPRRTAACSTDRTVTSPNVGADEPRWHMAIHECGHAVIGTDERFELVMVEIDGPYQAVWRYFMNPPDGDFENHQPYDPDNPLDDDDVETLLAQVRIWKAGCAAERHLIASATTSIRVPITDCVGDDVRCRWALRAITDDQEQQQALEAQCTDAAEAAVQNRWPQIVALAEFALDSGLVDGDNARAVIGVG